MEEKKQFKSQYERVTEITEKLESGVTDLFDSEKYKTWLTTMSKFHNYSLNNTLLIAMQRPDATYVAGYQAWQDKFGRHVKKGEKGIQILAPCKYKKKQMVDITTEGGKPILDSQGKPMQEEVTVEVPGFKVSTVFDISSTEGKELPTLGVNELTGDVAQYDNFMNVLKAICPVPISFENIESGAKGYYHQTDQRIAIQEGMSQVQTLKTLVHEMSHQRMHAIDPTAKLSDQPKQSRNSKEVEAESVAFTVLSHYGVDCSDYSFSYIASWSQGKEIPELKESLKTIRDTSSDIISEIDEAMKEMEQVKNFETVEGMETPFDDAPTAVLPDDMIADKKPSVLGYLKITPEPRESGDKHDKPIKLTSEMAI